MLSRLRERTDAVGSTGAPDPPHGATQEDYRCGPDCLCEHGVRAIVDTRQPPAVQSAHGWDSVTPTRQILTRRGIGAAKNRTPYYHPNACPIRVPAPIALGRDEIDALHEKTSQLSGSALPTKESQT